MILLIDADSALYKAGCANEKRWYSVYYEEHELERFPYKADAEAYAYSVGATDVEKHKKAGPIGITLANLRLIVSRMMELDHLGYEMYMSGDGNFRYDIYPEYKANRKAEDKPIHYEKMRAHLRGRYGCLAVHGQETDDEVSIRQMELAAEGVESCIVTIDKDLNNTPGWHYNYDTGEKFYVSEKEAELNFWRQMLTGDRTDNIPGLPRVGDVAAKKLLPDWSDDLEEKVYEAYVERGYDLERFRTIGKLLWMRRQRHDEWEPCRVA